MPPPRLVACPPGSTRSRRERPTRKRLCHTHHPPSAARPPPLLGRPVGFAPPPRGGFALIVRTVGHVTVLRLSAQAASEGGDGERPVVGGRPVRRGDCGVGKAMASGGNSEPGTPKTVGPGLCVLRRTPFHALGYIRARSKPRTFEAGAFGNTRYHERNGSMCRPGDARRSGFCLRWGCPASETTARARKGVMLEARAQTKSKGGER